MAQQISYTTRDFQAIRLELINYVQTYYPDLIQNVNDASVFSVFLDLNAAVTDNLNFNIDRALQETVLQYAQKDISVYNIARTYGLKIPGLRPSIALCDFSIIVPVDGDSENLQYCGVLRRGSQVLGAGQTFESLYDIDFSSEYNSEGFPNRLKIPNFNANGSLVNYTILKREPVVNGVTRVFKKVISQTDSRPFLEVFLPEQNVLGVTSVLLKNGNNFTNIPSAQEFLSTVDRWYEVQALAEDRIFIPDVTKTSDNPGIKVGKYLQTNQRFISEYTPQGFLKLTFGGGNQSTDELLRQYALNGITLDISKYQNNFSLGSTLKPTTTLFIQYRVGGGLQSNIGVGIMNQIGTINFSVNGPNSQQNLNTINSLQVNNVTAAVGGANAPTIEEIRNLVGFNFASQNRAVTINDYEAILRKMPSMFGAPAKVAITEEDNKIKINILSYDTEGNLSSNVSNTLQSNIANYLSNYRMINDYIFVNSANVIDLAFDVSVVLDASQNQGTVITNLVEKVQNYMSPSTREMGSNVYISEIRRLVQEEVGVITVTDIKVYNKVGGQYSSSQTSQRYSNSDTKQIELIDDTIFAEPTQIYDVRYPNKDIRIIVKNLTAVNFS
jgi:hypothetical protein|tara:strand:- start:485 stop:2320 length:1836 start_codon:yes stop_codon:yes gene_type:complete